MLQCSFLAESSSYDLLKVMASYSKVSSTVDRFKVIEVEVLLIDSPSLYLFIAKPETSSSSSGRYRFPMTEALMKLMPPYGRDVDP